MSICLSVNLNKIALIRNSRAGDYPSVTEHARLCIEAGADGITVHPRPDQRHIRAADVPALAAMLAVELNVEGNPFAGPARSHRADVADYPGFMALVRAVRPAQCTLVPDSRRATHLGPRLRPRARWRTPAPADRGTARAGHPRQPVHGSRSRADPLAAACGADRVELYTGPYAAAFAAGADPQAILRPHVEAAQRRARCRPRRECRPRPEPAEPRRLRSGRAGAAGSLHRPRLHRRCPAPGHRAPTVRAYQRCLGKAV
jgi:pyridoxine 5-phosphate synthase